MQSECLGVASHRDARGKHSAAPRRARRRIAEQSVETSGQRLETSRSERRRNTEHPEGRRGPKDHYEADGVDQRMRPMRCGVDQRRPKQDSIPPGPIQKPFRIAISCDTADEPCRMGYRVIVCHRGHRFARARESLVRSDSS